jgi:hypothetical protein
MAHIDEIFDWPIIFVHFLTMNRYALPFSPHEKLIREDTRYTCWDGRVFLEDDRTDRGAVAGPVDHKTSQWVWYQVSSPSFSFLCSSSSNCFVFFYS